MLNFKYITTKKYKSGRVIPPHGHNLYEIIYYINANGILNCSPNKIDVNDGFLYFYDADMSESEELKFRAESFILLKPNVLHLEVHNTETSIVTLGFTISNPNLKIDDNIFIDEATSARTYINRILEEYKKSSLVMI